MLRMNTIKVTRYFIETFKYVDIVEYPTEFEMWVQGIGDVVSKFEFGCPKKQPNGDVIDFEEFEKMVDGYIAEYGV